MRFRGEYRFLSNFYPCKIIAWEIEFPTSEHVYVAAKTTKRSLRIKIAKIRTAGQAKRFGYTFELRPDWEEIKVSMMGAILRRKFAHPALKDRLLAVEGDIIELNHWHDNFWGVCDCGQGCTEGEGKNHLGILLMALREDFLEEQVNTLKMMQDEDESVMHDLYADED